jgi:hypothetical protein
MKKRTIVNAIVWTPEMISYIKDNWHLMTNKQLADGLGLKLTTTRAKILELGFKRMELCYWSTEQTEYLLQNYKIMGDVEIAEHFENNFPKNKPWTKKHIVKKRRYLGLKHSQEELQCIFLRNKNIGRWALCAKKRWQHTGQTPDGTIRVWHAGKGRFKLPKIKIEGRWESWARATWEAANGPIPKGSNIVFKNNHEDLTLENLELLTDQELMQRTNTYTSQSLSDNYILGQLRLPPEHKEVLRQIPEIIELKRNLLKTKRLIKNGNNRASN